MTFDRNPQGRGTDRAAEFHHLTHVKGADDEVPIRLDETADVGAPALGGVIVGQLVGGRTLWQRFARSVPGAANLLNVFGLVNGDTVPGYKALFGATVPTAVSPASVGAAGTGTLAARITHVHGATDIASAASLATLTTRVTALEGTSEIVLYKATDQQLTSNSIAFQNITSLALPLAANEAFRFSMTVLFRCTVAAGLKLQFTLPAGAVMFFSSGPAQFAAAPVHYRNVGAATPVAVDGEAANVGLELMGTVVNAGTAGNMQLQAAQAVATVENTDFVVASSNLVAKKLAP